MSITGTGRTFLHWSDRFLLLFSGNFNDMMMAGKTAEIPAGIGNDDEKI